MWEEALSALAALPDLYPELRGLPPSSRSWVRWPQSCTNSDTATTSSTCSTRWVWPPHSVSVLRSTGQTEPIVVLDGDGSVLMNLGGLAPWLGTGRANLVHVIFDNGRRSRSAGFLRPLRLGPIWLAWRGLALFRR